MSAVVTKPKRRSDMAAPAYVGRIQRLVDEVAKMAARQFDVMPEQVVLCANFPMRTTTIAVRYIHATEVYNYLNLLRQNIANLKDPIFDQVGQVDEMLERLEIRKLARHFRLTEGSAARMWLFAKKVRALAPHG